MIDAEKIIKQLELQLDDLQKYADDGELLTLTQERAKEIIALLKEREPTEPVLDETTKRFYRCGVCGEYVGFIDSDVGDPDEKDCFCRNCGRAVKWP